jgi:hypothetical protein
MVWISHDTVFLPPVKNLSGLGSVLPLTTFLDETTYPLALAFIEYADDASVEKAATAFNDSDFGAGIVSATVTRSSLVGMLHASPGVCVKDVVL